MRYNQKKHWDMIAYSYLEGCDRILDIGCGIGRFLSLNPNKIYGIDGNPETVNRCKEMGYHVKLSDARNIDHPDGYFDGINCSHLIEHFNPEDMYKIMQEFDRLLKKGGVLVVSAPLLWSEFYSDLSHIKPYNPAVLINYLGSKNSMQRTRQLISTDYKVVNLKYRYQPLPFMRRFTGPLNRFGFPWIKKTGYMLVMKK